MPRHLVGDLPSGNLKKLLTGFHFEDKMKICHINMFYKPTFGGVEMMIEELALRQVRDGHEVHVICCDSDKYKRINVKEEVIDGIHVHRFPYWFRLSLSTHLWPSLLWKLRKYDFDVIHSHVSGHAYHLLAGLSKGNAVFVQTTHCPWTDAFRPWILKPFLWLNDKVLNKWAFSKIDKVISITPWEHDILKNWVSEDKIVTIPNGMNEVFFKKIKDNDFKKRFGVKGKMVLFFGRLNPTKGPEKLAMAAKEILKERDDIDFVFAGPDEGALDITKKTAGDEKKIHFLGPIRDKIEIVKMYQASDVYVLPSYREGLPLTLFEAMACGLPIVASPVNGVPYEMEDGVNGYFANYGDINSLKEKILNILNNPELARKIGLNNMKKAKNFNWDLIYKRYMDVYEECLEKKRDLSSIRD